MILKSNQELYLSHGKQFLLGELGQLLAWASGNKVRSNAKVYWYDDRCVDGRTVTVPIPVVRSYRGIYSDIAIGHVSSPTNLNRVADFIAVLRNAIGIEYPGYRGGEYRMTRNTPVWVGNYGEATGVFIRGVVLTAPGEETEMGMVELVTGDDYWRAEGFRGDGTEARMEGRV